MSTQYDTIQGPYDEIKKTFIKGIERQNVQEVVAPLIEGARVLDLACGTGFYSREFIKWGASQVVGVDISSGMLAEARRIVDSAEIDSQATFLQADCTQPAAYAGGPFRVVFGAWLLNYARSAGDLTDMFRTIALNLEDGGQFIGVTPPPTQDPVAFYEAEHKARPNGSGMAKRRPTGRVEGGVTVHYHADTPLGTADFDFFHLRRDIYEAAATNGGLCGEVEWRVTSIPAGLESGAGDASMEEIASYETTPNYGLLIISKGG